MLKSDFQQTKAYQWIPLSLGLLFLIGALWLPFGFSLGALIEEWGILGTYSNYGLFFIATVNSPLAAHALRPLTVFPHSLAYFLDPNSFNYWNILLILSLLVKGLTMSYLVKQISHSWRWAFLAGILLIVYPADTMQLSFRALHINWSLSLILLGSSLFLAAAQTKNTAHYLVFSSLTFLSVLAALSMYESALLLVLLPFLILACTKDNLKILFQRKLLILFWCAALIIYFLYTHFTAEKISSYQSALMGSNSLFKLLSLYYPKLFSIGALRLFFGSWFDSFRILFSEFSWQGCSYLTVVFLSLLGFFLLLKNSKHQKLAFSLKLRMLAIGFVLAMLGYLPYALLPSHAVISQRTFLFAEPGAVLACCALMFLIGNRLPKFAFSLTFALIFLGLSSQFFQFHHYVTLSLKQRELLKTIVENYDAKENKTLLILDKSNQLNYTWMFLIGYLNSSLNYVYGHPIKPIELCRSPDYSWQQASILSEGLCVEDKNSWSFEPLNSIHSAPTDGDKKVIRRIDKKELILLTIEEDGSVIANPKLNSYRQHLKTSPDIEAIRFRNLLKSPTWLTYFDGLWKKSAPDHYHWDFGDWWSLEKPIQGNGWREAEWQVNFFYHQAVAWKQAKIARLQFNLIPSAPTYQLKIYLTNVVNQKIRDSLKLSLNSNDISFVWQKENSNRARANSEELTAILPMKYLLSGINSLVFDSELAPDYYQLAFQLDAVDLKPINNSSLSQRG